MNYALTQMSKGDIASRPGYFQRAQAYNPNYYVLEINLGVANGALHNDAETQRHFARAIQLSPRRRLRTTITRCGCAEEAGRGEAIQQLNTAIATIPLTSTRSHLLMDIYADALE